MPEAAAPYRRLKQILDAGGLVLLDGPTGTELQRRGAPMDPAAWCGPATLGNDALLQQIHADYIVAGADIVTANSFASSRLMLKGAGLADRVEEINRRAVAAACAARDGSARAGEVAVAGSLSHMVPVAVGSDVVDPRQVPSRAEMSDAFHELAQILKRAGCELILLEMMYNPERAPLALEAALSTGLPVWFGASARRTGDGRVIAFDRNAEYELDAVARLIPASGVDAAGIMHSQADLIDDALSMIRRRFVGPLLAYPDSGYFESPDWRFVDTLSPERFLDFCRGWRQRGVQIIGGCCGLSVDHIRAAATLRGAG